MIMHFLVGCIHCLTYTAEPRLLVIAEVAVFPQLGPLDATRGTWTAAAAREKPRSRRRFVPKCRHKGVFVSAFFLMACVASTAHSAIYLSVVSNTTLI